AQSVNQQKGWSIAEIPYGGGPRDYLAPYATYAVGAFDLVAYNDAFLSQRWQDEFVAGQATGPRGLFNYGWPPAYQATLQEIADAANAQSRQDYANLQTSSGMFRLISTAAWLRFLSTPPRESQTVSGYEIDSRSFVDEAPTTATSPNILFYGV